jgi:hydroxypyruvate isomerase
MSTVKQSFCIPCFWKSAEPADVRETLERAAAIGYPAFEFWFRDGIPFDLMCRLSKDLGLTIACMSGHGTLQDGLNKRENHGRIRDELLVSIDLAQQHGIPNLICFSGNREGKDDATCIGVVADGLAMVTEEAEAAGVMLNMELLNSKIDHPDYQADHTAWGVEVARQVGSPNVRLLYDIYHMQIMEGDLCRTITDNIDHIGHFHTAGNPGRKDPDDTQEINYPAVMRAIAEAGYDRYVGHEFSAKGDKLEALETAFRICNV